ncbi:hypothetical protein ABFT80_23510 [Mesorhizobium sp. SB112]|uniref:hypothetical protein n=1 Tax=Mesorhizobium sp. SB112 TaxID=3151853 RepID=UPI00326531D9
MKNRIIHTLIVALKQDRQMPTLVEELRAVAASPASRTKAEMVEILLAAADRIEANRIEMTRMKHNSENTGRSGRGTA